MHLQIVCVVAIHRQERGDSAFHTHPSISFCAHKRTDSATLTCAADYKFAPYYAINNNNNNNDQQPVDRVVNTRQHNQIAIECECCSHYKYITRPDVDRVTPHSAIPAVRMCYEIEWHGKYYFASNDSYFANWDVLSSARVETSGCVGIANAWPLKR